MGLFWAKYARRIFAIVSTTSIPNLAPVSPTEATVDPPSRGSRLDADHPENGVLIPRRFTVLPGNTSDKTTLRGFLERIERQYGKARRIWLMDRGVPTEEVLTQMRAADPPMHYLVGTPKGRVTRLERHLVAKPWQEARPGVQSLPQRRLGSNCWRKRASSTSWPKAAIGSPRSGRCDAAS